LMRGIEPSTTGLGLLRHAFFHEARARGARELPAIAADGLGRAGVPLAFMHEGGLRGSRQRLAVLAYGFAFAGSAPSRARTSTAAHYASISPGPKDAREHAVYDGGHGTSALKTGCRTMPSSVISAYVISAS